MSQLQDLLAKHQPLSSGCVPEFFGQTFYSSAPDASISDDAVNMEKASLPIPQHRPPPTRPDLRANQAPNGESNGGNKQQKSLIKKKYQKPDQTKIKEGNFNNADFNEANLPAPKAGVLALFSPWKEWKHAILNRKGSSFHSFYAYKPQVFYADSYDNIHPRDNYGEMPNLWKRS